MDGDLHALLRLTRGALEDPSTPANMMPQLLGVAVRAAIAIERLGIRNTDLPPEVMWRDEPPNGHNELGPVGPTILPGPPWAPFEGMPEPVQVALNQQLLARAWVWHMERAALLRLDVTDEEIDAAQAELVDIRASYPETSKGATCYDTLVEGPPAGGDRHGLPQVEQGGLCTPGDGCQSGSPNGCQSGSQRLTAVEERVLEGSPQSAHLDANAQAEVSSQQPQSCFHQEPDPHADNH
jgi:hypothetical protein